MTEDVAALRALHEELRIGRFEGDQYELLHRFGNAGFVEARSTVESFLTNPDPQLRYVALNVLVLHWGIQEHQESCIRMMEADPDSDVRRLAARCVGELFSESKSAEALRSLLRIVAAEHEEWDVRDAAYASLLEVLGVPRSEWPIGQKLRWPADINWRRIREAEAIVGDSYAS